MEIEEREFLRSVFPWLDVDNLPVDEAPAPSRFPCERCGGTGLIDVVENGHICKAYCPECRVARKTAAIVAASGIHPEDYQRFTLESFQVDTPEAREAKQAAEKFIRERPAGKGVLAMGKSGTGKTHICVAILQALNEYHHYWKYRREIQRIKNVMYQNNDEYQRLITEAICAKNLYIDDLFQSACTGGTVDKQDLQIMFEIIDARYVNRASTFFSANLSERELIKSSEPLASRIFEMTSPYILVPGKTNRRGGFDTKGDYT